MDGRFTKGRYAIPELPEVETVRRELAPWLTGQVITRAARVHAPSSPKYADIDVALGKRIVEVKRRGKFLLLPLVDSTGEQSWELIIHLGMTGVVKRVADVMVDTAITTGANQTSANQTSANKAGTNKAGTNKVDAKKVDTKKVDTDDDNAVTDLSDDVVIADVVHNNDCDDKDDVDKDVVDKYVRVRLELRSDTGEVSHLLFEDMRRFGRFLVVSEGDYSTLPTLRSMGAEPFDEALTEARFWQMLQNSKTAIKTYLLSQRPVAGVGNIYADEALWEARIHPKTPAFRISKKHASALLVALREVLAKSIELQGTTLRDYRTVNGEVGQFASYLRVYGKTAEPCPRCGHPIERLMIGGRSSHLCPACQKRS